KKTPIIKIIKAAIVPPIDLENNIYSDTIISDIGRFSSINLLPINYNTPIIPKTLKKIYKYFTKENFNKKGITILYYRPPSGFV
ncbi:hypothetical protein NEUTE2DRAFT_53729, partial [Neurospora tetrasperma FGSC 2509]